MSSSNSQGWGFVIYYDWSDSGVPEACNDDVPIAWDYHEAVMVSWSTLDDLSDAGDKSSLMSDYELTDDECKELKCSCGECKDLKCRCGECTAAFNRGLEAEMGDLCQEISSLHVDMDKVKEENRQLKLSDESLRDALWRAKCGEARKQEQLQELRQWIHANVGPMRDTDKTVEARIQDLLYSVVLSPATLDRIGFEVWK